MNVQHLREPLESLYRTYDIRHLSSDPLSLVRALARPEDQEAAGLIAAVFAYGRVGQILKTVRAILAPMGDSPYAFVRRFDLRKDADLFRGIVHRFNNETDVVALILGMRQVFRRYGSLRALFLKGYSSRQKDIGEALTRFVDYFLGLDYGPLDRLRQLPPGKNLGFLLPSPRNRSACKRLNMFLRWMVRRGDDLDLGLWEEVSPAQLIIPLDTHLFRITSRLGLTRRRTADWATASEVTGNLRRLAPEDPVKYDFALARLGILKRCGAEEDPLWCGACLLGKVCATKAADSEARKSRSAFADRFPGSRRRI